MVVPGGVHHHTHTATHAHTHTLTLTSRLCLHCSLYLIRGCTPCCLLRLCWSQVAPEFAEYSLEEFSWARMMVASRNFGVTMGDLKTDVLVPLADMLNHYRPRETKYVGLHLQSRGATEPVPLLLC